MDIIHTRKELNQLRLFRFTFLEICLDVHTALAVVTRPAEGHTEAADIPTTNVNTYKVKGKSTPVTGRGGPRRGCHIF
jgi:hypothetical protein